MQRRAILIGAFLIVFCAAIAFAERANVGKKSRRETKQVLFVCTGNFYRSRFAEILFNYRARQSNSDWRAVSRGLNLVASQQGISPIAVRELKSRGISQFVETEPKAVSTRDVEKSDCIVLMDEREHRVVFEKEFPTCDKSKVRYWHIRDGQSHAATSCKEMSDGVDELLKSLDARGANDT